MLLVTSINNYKLTQKLGISPFYQVYKGQHIKNQTLVAIKLEQRTNNESKLYNEHKIIKDIQGEDTAQDYGIPHVFLIGHEQNHNFLVMDLLGPSLDRYMADNGGKIKHTQALELGVQMIDRLQLLHSKGYVHRDLRPEHFLYGRQKWPNKIYLSGFANSKKYRRYDGKHLPYKDNKSHFTGTARYMSINTHLCIQQSRRDDIQTLLYILIYLIKGHLPWQNQKANGKLQKYQKILQLKMTIPIQTVCEGVPWVIGELLQIARTMEYEQIPDYEGMRMRLSIQSQRIRKGVYIQ